MPKRTYRIAVIPGDGIGQEVIPEGLKALRAVEQRDPELRLEFESFPWGCDYYLEHGEMMAADGLDQLKSFSAVYFGAVGWPTVPDHVSLWGLRLAICQGFQQYANVRPARLLRGVTGPLRDACAVREQCRDSTDGLYLHLCRVAKYLERLQAAESGVDRLRLLAEITSISTTKGNAERWPPSAPSRTIKSQLKQSQAARAAIIDGIKGPVLFALMAALRAFILAWAQERRREGQLQFHDLLVLARNLLRDHAGVRAALRAQYTHLLLDEFQDTDPIQAEIAVLLGSEDGASGSWLDAGVGPGRLFFVGDPKQSIYRFRRADIELYMDIQQRFAEGCVQLSQNFRSVPGILDWANHVFTTLMQSDNLRGQPAYVPLNPTREGACCPVWVVGGPSDDYADEDMFNELPLTANTVKVGAGRTAARYRISSVRDVIKLLQSLAK